MSAKVSIIAAISEQRGIGKNNQLLWHISEDLKRFKKLTLHHPVIMGRITFESIDKPLPERVNIVVTRDKDYQAKGCLICYSLKQAVELAKQKDQQEIFIIGGGQIYSQAIDIADKLYLTVIKGDYSADTFFPDYSAFSKVISKKASRDKDYSYTFLDLERSHERN